MRIPPADAVDPQTILPPIGSPIGAWRKVLIWLAETAAQGILLSQYEEGTDMAPAGAGADGTEASEWRRFQMRWANTTSLEASDDQVYTHDVVNITGGKVDSTWTQADRDVVVGQLVNIATAISNYTVSYLTLSEVRVYRMAFNPYSQTKPFAESGAPEELYPVSIAGKLAQPGGPQVCSTVTEQTGSRRHWGRFYSPSLGANAYVGGGRLGAAAVNAYANVVHANYEELMNREFLPVVPVTQQANAPIDNPDGSVTVTSRPLRALQSVSGIRVDDVPDVQRRRRPKFSSYRVILPLAATTQPAE